MIAGKDVAALILCAGRSSRMGVLKPLLTLGKETLLCRSIGLFRKAGVKDILVVLGWEAQSIRPLLEKLGTAWVVNEDYDRGMFSSIQTGVRHLNRKRRAFFLHPVDIPFVRPATIRSLIRFFEPGKTAVCRPHCQGRYGHPPLISTDLLDMISECEGEGGMRRVFSLYGEGTRRVECNDPGILKDIDTPEDCQKAAEAFLCK
jgi:molybdenum cofactor cytidylyltransferase